jgi:hypothetical protein
MLNALKERPMTTTNISDPWRERRAAIAEFEVTDDEHPVMDRLDATSPRMKRSARRGPSLSLPAVQMRLLEASIQTGHREDERTAASIAEQLEKLAPAA